MSETVLVAGAGGFIGGHVAGSLHRDGYRVRAVDVKPLDEWYQVHDGVENIGGDVSSIEVCDRVTDGIGEVYNLAADMGGMGFIENNKALCMLSVLPSTHLLLAARNRRVKRFFYASSAC